MVRVLHVIHGMDCGGTENMIMNLYRKIDRKKLQFDFLVHTDKPCFFDEEIKKLGGKIYQVPYYNLINELKYRKSISLFLKTHPEYKIIHGHLGSCAHIYLKIAKKYGLYAIAHSHSANSSITSLKNILYLSFNRITGKIADHIFACSYEAGICRYGKKVCTESKFEVIKNAIDSEKYLPDMDAVKSIKDELLLDNSFTVGHIGRLTEAKNHAFLLKVFAEILNLKPDAKLLLVGEGELRKEIEAKVKEMGLCEKVIITGIRSDVSQIIHTMDCFVFTSLYEGLGIAVIEAECAGIPCFINKTLPKDLDINPNLFRISLKETPLEWAKIIVDNCNNKIDNKVALENIKKSGYDISKTATHLENFYNSIMEEKAK
ncbi:MAG: glycosyltransferase family 1 protein [Ruminococcaceae bacterium]|nr:glycosyltransferase family 1 protein [Oscillospiraceae bacterium]